MIDSDIIIGCAFALILGGLGAVVVRTTWNNRPTLGIQLAIFGVAFAARVGVSLLLYAFGLAETIVGDGDDSGWAGGVVIKEAWEQEGLSPLEWPIALMRAFDGTNRGYKYLLAAYFSITRVPSRFSAAALNCLCGALTAVFVYRVARIRFSEWVATRVGWWTCLFPGMIIWSAQTVKEPIVIFLEALVFYGGLRMQTDGFRIRHVLLASGAVVVLAALRFYATYITGGAVLFALLMPQFGRRKFTLGAGLAMGAIALSVLYFSGAVSNHASELEKWDIQQTAQFRRDIAAGTGSGVELKHDMRTNRGFGIATLIGAAHLLLAPFPWNMGTGSARLLLVFPEQLFWWYLFVAGVIPGLWYAVRRRLGDVVPFLLFIAGLGLIYSVTFGNIGVVYRQRAQLLPYLLIFAAIGLERRRSGHSGGNSCESSSVACG